MEDRLHEIETLAGSRTRRRTFSWRQSILAQEYYGPPRFGYWQHQAEETWERHGFYDGVRGADHDFWNHRRPDVNNRDEFRYPASVPGWAWHEYREGDTTSG